MIKNKASIEISLHERPYVLLCDSDSPIDELLIVLEAMKSIASKRLQELSQPQEIKENEDVGQA